MEKKTWTRTVGIRAITDKSLKKVLSLTERGVALFYGKKIQQLLKIKQEIVR